MTPTKNIPIFNFKNVQWHLARIDHPRLIRETDTKNMFFVFPSDNVIHLLMVYGAIIVLFVLLLVDVIPPLLVVGAGLYSLWRPTQRER